jgi:flavodoxin
MTLESKSIIVYVSTSHGNTEKIAKTIASVLGASLVAPNQVAPKDLLSYGLMGLGSGIYHAKHDKSLLELADNLPPSNKKVFIFSTSGMGEKSVQKDHEALRTKLMAKGFDIVGEFNCRGFDTYGPLKLVGGIAKGRPNEQDLKAAEEFAKTIKEKINAKIG